MAPYVFTTEYLQDLRYYTVRRKYPACTVFRHAYIEECCFARCCYRCCSVCCYIYCCCCSCCCLLLLFVIVCGMSKSIAGLIPVFFFLFIQTRFISNVPLGSTVACTASNRQYTHPFAVLPHVRPQFANTPPPLQCCRILWHLQPRFAYTASSVITGMRGVKAGVSPPRRNPPCIRIVVI